MHPVAISRSRYRSVALAAALSVLSCAAASLANASEASTPAPAGGPPFQIRHEIIAAGGIDRARSACFDLASTIAQPVTGSSSGGAFSLSTGFLDELASRDSLFRSGFESCQP